MAIFQIPELPELPYEGRYWLLKVKEDEINNLQEKATR